MDYVTLTPVLAANRASRILACSADVSDWRLPALMSDLPNKWDLSFLAGDVNGYAILSCKFGPKPHLHQFMVHPLLRGQGIGALMLDECHRRCHEFTLKVHRSNAGAIRFYETRGLHVTGNTNEYWWMST